MNQELKQMKARVLARMAHRDRVLMEALEEAERQARVYYKVEESVQVW